MGKLLNDLKKQLKTKNKVDAEKCIKLYEDLLNSTGHVWSSQWQVLTEVSFEGTYPNNTRTYKPSRIGELVLEGLNTQSKK